MRGSKRSSVSSVSRAADVSGGTREVSLPAAAAARLSHRRAPMRFRRASTRLLLLACALLTGRAASGRFPVDDGDRVILPGNVPAQARPERDLGRSDPNLPMEGMTLLLSPAAGAAPALESLLAAQQDPASPSFHRWITPEEFGRRF